MDIQVYKKNYIQSIGFLYEALAKVSNTINSENKYNAQSIKELIINNLENYENELESDLLGFIKNKSFFSSSKQDSSEASHRLGYFSL